MGAERLFLFSFLSCFIVYAILFYQILFLGSSPLCKREKKTEAVPRECQTTMYDTRNSKWSILLQNKQKDVQKLIFVSTFLSLISFLSSPGVSAVRRASYDVTSTKAEHDSAPFTRSVSASFAESNSKVQTRHPL